MWPPSSPRGPFYSLAAALRVSKSEVDFRIAQNTSRTTSTRSNNKEGTNTDRVWRIFEPRGGDLISSKPRDHIVVPVHPLRVPHRIVEKQPFVAGVSMKAECRRAHAQSPRCRWCAACLEVWWLRFEACAICTMDLLKVDKSRIPPLYVQDGENFAAESWPSRLESSSKVATISRHELRLETRDLIPANRQRLVDSLTIGAYAVVGTICRGRAKSNSMRA